AALGCAQLEQLSARLERKRRLHEAYCKWFDGFDGVRMLREPSSGRSNHWLNALVLDEPDLDTRNAILDRAAESDLMLRPLWDPLHTLPPYAHFPRAPLPEAERLAARIINLPSSAHLANGLGCKQLG
ncbi:MAG: DegT/DnrJ/EryC1/StrS family aminotransferase, partial [Myxococcota bacterium]